MLFIKRRMLCAGMALLLGTTTAAPASAAFSDISDGKLAQTAVVLDALGIMQGMGNGLFAPEGDLTRAQFCKLAVTAMGVTEVSGYGSYTIFPDVPGTYWASSYINAAVRDTELKKLSIIRGYADGTFRPNRTVSYGEACTMLLRMLGYADADIGPFWPQDYITFAENLGLSKDVPAHSASDPVKRSDAATMLLNTLNTPQKGDSDNTDNTLMTKITSSIVKNCILLATHDTDSNLAENEAIFYENGEVASLPRKTTGKLDKNLIGTNGTLLVGKKDEKVILGMIPNENKVETMSILKVDVDSFRTETQKITPNRDTKLYIAREKKLDTYSNIWSNIMVGDTLTMYYDEYGSLELMAILPTLDETASRTFIYGVATAVKIPEEYTIVKNGVIVDRTGLRKYDVVTLDASTKKAWVSDKKLTGVYQGGTPTFRYPQEITMYNDKYKIADTSAKLFQNYQPGDKITLLFNVNKEIVAVYPKSSVSMIMEGVLTEFGEGDAATIVLTNGLTIHTNVRKESMDQKLLGELVLVSQSNDQTSLMARELRGKENGAWDISLNTLGSRKVSPDVCVFEKVVSEGSLNPVDVFDIPVDIVPSNQIRNTFVDSAGTITAVVLGDVTGKSWLYGIGYSHSTGVDDDATHTAGLRYWNGKEMVFQKYPVEDMPRGLGGLPVRMSKGYTDKAMNKEFASQMLLEVDTVDRDAIEGTTGVRTKQGYYDIIDDVGVYLEADKDMCSLMTAKNNYTEFTLYADKALDKGGRICLIIIKDKKKSNLK